MAGPDPLEDFFLYGNPNPNRIGCPGSEVIQKLARRELPIDHPARKHLSECSPCFREFRTLLPKAEERRQPRRTVLVLASVAAMVIAAFLGFAVRRLPSTGVGGNAIMNFATSQNRGVSPSGTGQPTLEVQSYPRQKLLLTVNLPPGSDDGRYELEMLSADESRIVVHATGDAVISNGLTTFTAKVDLTHFAPGMYLARVRRPPVGAWDVLTVQVK
jgi:hypothetical protein